MRKILTVMGTLGGICGGLAPLMIDTWIDTGPLICKFDSTCRKLTKSESDFAHSIFGNKIRTEDILMFERGTAYDFLKRGVNQAEASVTHNSVYYPPVNRVGEKDEVLSHEFTHIAQNQNNIPSISGRKYGYVLSPDKNFYDYGVEQQASIVQGYYTKKKRLKNYIDSSPDQTDGPSTYRDKFLDQDCDELKKYETILKPIIDVKPLPACVIPRPSLS